MNKLKDFAADARQLGLYGRVAALSWVARHGWAPAVVLDAAGAMSGKSRGTSHDLAAAGYLRPVLWDCSTHVKFVYHITDKGLDFLNENLDAASDFARSIGYPTVSIPDKIPKFTSKIAVHNLFCQILCAIALIDYKQYGRAYYYKPAAQFKGGDKIPDFMIQRQGVITDFFEFEYSKKSTPEITDFVDYYYRKLSLDQHTRLFVYFANRSLEKPFKSAWTPGRLVFTYSRDVAGRWVKKDIFGTTIELEPGELRADLSLVSWPALLARLGSLGKVPPLERLAPAGDLPMKITGPISW